MTITVDEFRRRVRANELEELVEDVLLADSALHVTAANILKISKALSARFDVEVATVYLRIVGSAKLGFSISEKSQRGGPPLPRYRRFSPESDIDVMVICPGIFDSIWNDLCSHAHRAARLPWNSDRLGDYMICGWLRPDHFPKEVNLRRCDDWWDVFRQISADPSYGRRKVRGGLFHSLTHARKYLMRALADCARAESLET